METGSLTNVLLDDEPRRVRAKDRLYVICQSAGWLFFLGLQIFLILAFPSMEHVGPGETLRHCAIVTEVVALGWLITHFTRPLVTRWGVA